MYCEPCLDEGRKQKAHRIVVENHARTYKCRWHFQGIPHPASRATNLSTQDCGDRTPQIQTDKREAMMPRSKIQIDLERLRALHAEGRHDKEIGKALGCSGHTIWQHRNELELPANTKRKSAALNHTLGTPSQPMPSREKGELQFVPIRAGVLDRLWAALEATEKATAINYLIEAAQAR